MLQVLPVAKKWCRLLGAIKKFLLDSLDIPKVCPKRQFILMDSYLFIPKGNSYRWCIHTYDSYHSYLWEIHSHASNCESACQYCESTSYCTITVFQAFCLFAFYWHSACVTQRNICCDLVDCIKLQFLISSVCVKHGIYFDQKCCELLSSLCGWQHWRYVGWIYAMAFILAALRRWFFTVQRFRRVAVC